MAKPIDKQRSTLPGDRIVWGAVPYYVHLAADGYVWACSQPLCGPFSHCHLKVLRALLVWVESLGEFRAVWDKATAQPNP